MMTTLKHEIKQNAPFSGIEEEAILNLFRTSDFLERAFEHESRGWGITSTQYNVLRILRGAGPEGLPCAAIGERMVTAGPDITRILSRLKARKLIRQHHSQSDRRVVCTQISEAGLSLLREMDPLIQRLPGTLLGHMSKSDLKEMIRLLEGARAERSRLTCDGTRARSTEGEKHPRERRKVSKKNLSPES
jgi:DNA-binding MarR family transcriptional regulator